jgi:hypothetical protein
VTRKILAVAPLPKGGGAYLRFGGAQSYRWQVEALIR